MPVLTPRADGLVESTTPVLLPVMAPRLHMQWVPDELRIEKYGMAPDVRTKLEAMGYTVVVKEPMGDVNAIVVDAKTGQFLGATDPRAEF